MVHLASANGRTPTHVYKLHLLLAARPRSRLTEGAPEAQAVQELLCALLALRRVAEASRPEPVSKLLPTAAQAAAYATAALLKRHQADDLPEVWQTGGESSCAGDARAALRLRCTSSARCALLRCQTAKRGASAAQTYQVGCVIPSASSSSVHGQHGTACAASTHWSDLPDG